jgi:hypothetical protein
MTAPTGKTIRHLVASACTEAVRDGRLTDAQYKFLASMRGHSAAEAVETYSRAVPVQQLVSAATVLLAGVMATDPPGASSLAEKAEYLSELRVRSQNVRVFGRVHMRVSARAVVMIVCL